jgi:hypothetical protein
MVKMVLAVLVLAGISMAQAPTGGRGKQIGTPTRQVTMFSGLERQLLGAQKDKTLLDAMLTEDFQEWNAEQPADPVDRETAMQRVQAAPAVQGGIRDMNVRMEGDTAIVSFVFVHRAEKEAGEPRTNATFIVDVWRKHGETYELAARYASPMRMQAMNLRPTGKE